MKKILLSALICITLFSCKKDPSTPSGTDVSGSLQYKVNGNLVVMDNVDLLTGQYVIFRKLLKGIVNETMYQLGAQKGSNNAFLMTIETDSLQQKNYHYDSTINNPVGFLIDYNGQLAYIASGVDYFDVNITNYKNSRVSGTFTAKFTPLLSGTYGQPGSIIITEGKINNVQVIY